MWYFAVFVNSVFQIRMPEMFTKFLMFYEVNACVYVSSPCLNSTLSFSVNGSQIRTRFFLFSYVPDNMARSIRYEKHGPIICETKMCASWNAMFDRRRDVVSSKLSVGLLPTCASFRQCGHSQHFGGCVCVNV